MTLIVQGRRRRIFVSVAAPSKISDQQLKSFVVQLLLSPEKTMQTPIPGSVAVVNHVQVVSSLFYI